MFSDSKSWNFLWEGYSVMTFWRLAYKFGWATKEQLKQAVAGKLITAAA